MKKKFIFLSILFSFKSFCQYHNANFVFGYNSASKNPELGITMMKFGKGDSITYKIPKKGRMYINSDCSAISDKAGKIVMYSNGQYLENSSQDTVENSVFFKNGSSGSTIFQGSLILPFPDKDSMYLTMHQYSDFLAPDIYGIAKFRYGIVDMSLNGGKGKMISKGIDVMPTNTYPTYGKLTAVKQANGKDWWIYTMQDNNKGFGSCNTFYRYQLTKNGFSFVDKQIIDKEIPDGVGTAAFSPDGKKYAVYNNVGPTLGRQLDVFDFDRCTGKFSNHQTIKYPTDDYGGAGVAFSPNSRFLYVGLDYYLGQYDMKGTSLKEGEKIIAKSKKLTNCGDAQVNFDNMELAPNGKIYIAGYGCAKIYHVINQPNLADTLCQLEQGGLVLPTYYFASITKFPNFQLGKADCSVAVEEVESEKVGIYPNPSIGQVNISLQNENEAVEMFISDLTGKYISQYTLKEKENTIDVAFLENGVYFCVFKKNNQVLATKRLFILK